MSCWAVTSVVRHAEQAGRLVVGRGQAHAGELGQERRPVGGVEQDRPLEQLALQLVGRADDRDACRGR